MEDDSTKGTVIKGPWKKQSTKKVKTPKDQLQNQLQEDLQLKIPPRRIESFDVSHLAGEDTVASMVSFVDGKSKKSEYRKYKIKGVNGIDDFAAIREVVFRRYKKLKDEKLSFPDLILIDGGKGQLNICLLYTSPSPRDS